MRTVAEWVGGTVEGDADVVICGLAPLSDAGSDQLSFADDKHLSDLAGTEAGAAFVSTDADVEQAKLALIRVDNVDSAVATVLGKWTPPEQRPAPGVADSAVVDASAKLGQDVAIGSNVVIGPGAVIGDRTALCANVSIGQDVTIGDDAMIAEGVVISARCQVGQRVRIGANSVVGGEGFGYYFADGVHNRLPHCGNVIIADDVDLGSCVCVDRGKFGPTRIGKGTKIDNFVQIAHNVQIGENCLMAAQCGIAGSTKIGNFVVMGGSTGVRDNISIGDGTMVTAYSAVASDIPPGEQIGGIPARPLKQMRRFWLSQPKLPDLFQRVKKLESALKKLNESSTDN